MKDDAGELRVCMNVLMGQIGIDYSKLTKEEQMTLLRVFNKSSMLKHRTKAGMRGKHRRGSFALRLIGGTLLRQDGRTYTIGSSASLRWVGKDRQLLRPSAHPPAAEQVLAGASRSPFSASAGTKV